MNEQKELTEAEKKVIADNVALVDVLKSAAYVLISSFTARKAFLEMCDKIETSNPTPLSESFAVEARKIRADEMKKLQERLAMYQ